MYALSRDSVQSLLEQYPACVVDYCLVACGGEYRGEESHREALGIALRSVSETDSEGEIEYRCEVGSAKCRRVAAAEFLGFPEHPWKKETRYKGGSVATWNDFKTAAGSLPYWYAFVAPPHGSCPIEAFRKVNAVLFPKGTEGLVVLEWSTDWSDYFDDGREWWGTACYSAYDPGLDRIAVIMASSTD